MKGPAHARSIPPRDPRRPARGWSRRQLLTRGGALGAAGISLPAFLAACGGDDDDAATGATAGTTPGTSAGTTPGTAAGGTAAPGGEGGELFFENWPEYIDLTEDGAVGTVDRFMEATGISMRYTEAFNDNNEYFALIQPVLGARRHDRPRHHRPHLLAGRPFDHLGWVDELPLDQIPNAANLRGRPAEPDVGPDRASTRCRGRPASPASPTTSTRPAAS